MCSVTGQDVEFEKTAVRTDLITLKSCGHQPNATTQPTILDFDASTDIRESRFLVPPKIFTTKSLTHLAIQTECAKISILKVEILRVHLTFKKITVLSFESVTRDLQSWYDKLPSSLYLHNLEENDALPPDVMRSAFHLHLLYMGATLLIYRRMASQYSYAFIQQSNQQFLGDGPETIPIGLLKQGIDAARASAGICLVLLQDDAMSRRCWIVMYVFSWYRVLDPLNIAD